MKLDKLLSLLPFIASTVAVPFADPSLAGWMDGVAARNAASSRLHSETKRHGAGEMKAILDSLGDVADQINEATKSVRFKSSTQLNLQLQFL